MRLLLSIFAVMLMVQSANAQGLWRNSATTNRVPWVSVMSSNIVGTVTNPVANSSSNYFGSVSAPGGFTSAASNYFGTVGSTNILDPSNVKYWGAKGDNSTDDTLSISNSLRTGKTYLPTGVYKISSQLTVQGELWGDGITSVIVQTADTNAIWIPQNSGQLKANIHDLYINDYIVDHAQTRNYGAAIALGETGGSGYLGFSVKNVLVYGFLDGVMVRSTIGSTLERVRVNNAIRDAFRFDGVSTSLSVQSCLGVNIGRYGFNIGGPDNEAGSRLVYSSFIGSGGDHCTNAAWFVSGSESISFINPAAEASLGSAQFVVTNCAGISIVNPFFYAPDTNWGSSVSGLFAQGNIVGLSVYGGYINNQSGYGIKVESPAVLSLVDGTYLGTNHLGSVSDSSGGVLKLFTDTGVYVNGSMAASGTTASISTTNGSNWLSVSNKSITTSGHLGIGTDDPDNTLTILPKANGYGGGLHVKNYSAPSWNVGQLVRDSGVGGGMLTLNDDSNEQNVKLNATGNSYFKNDLKVGGTITATNGVSGAYGFRSCSTNISVAMVAGTYTNCFNGNISTIKSFGGVNCGQTGITNATGATKDFYVSINLSFAGAGAASLYEGSLFVSGVINNEIEFQRDVTTTVGSASTQGVVTLTNGAWADFRMKSPDSETATMVKFNMTMMGAN